MSNAEYEIVPILTGVFQEHEKSMFTYGRDFGKKIRAPIICYLIRGHGRHILVDTGGADPEFSKQYHNQNVIRTEDMSPVNALRNLGVTVDMLDCVVLTHLHWDHCYNNPDFRGRKMYVQRREVEFADTPLPAFWTTYEHEAAGFPAPPWKSCRGDLVQVDGDVDLAPGIRLIALPGHSPGFQGVLVNTRAGNFLIASDLVPLAENWRGTGILKRVMTAMCFSMVEAYASYDKIERLGVDDRILHGHEMGMFDKAVYP